MCDTQQIAQHARRELTVARVRQARVKANLEHFLDAKLAQRPRPLSRALQAKGRDVRLEEAARVRIEHRDAQRNAKFIGHLTGAGDDGLVADVHAVEIAKRDRCAARIVRNC
jgi:hypothetical protein